MALGLQIIPVAHAAGLDLGSITPTGWEASVPQLLRIIDAATNILLATAGSVAFIVFAYAAFLFFTANGADNKIAAAKNYVLYAVIGLALIILSKTLIFVFITLFGGTV